MSYEIVVMGASLGGRQVIETLLAGLPADFPAPLLVVLHRGKEPDETFATMLRQRSPLPLEEAEDKQAIRPGRVYLAPPDYHLLVERIAEQATLFLSLSTEAPVWYARPSIDVLFESAADACRERTLGVILTGNSQDGARGLARIRRLGGAAVVQDPVTAEGKIMPKAALAAIKGLPSDRLTVLPPAEIAPFLVELVTAKMGGRR